MPTLNKMLEYARLAHSSGNPAGTDKEIPPLKITMHHAFQAIGPILYVMRGKFPSISRLCHYTSTWR